MKNIIIRRSLKFILNSRHENFEKLKLFKEVEEHAKHLQLRENITTISDIRHNNDYFVILFVRKRKDKIKVKIWGFVKDYNITDDIQIYI